VYYLLAEAPVMVAVGARLRGVMVSVAGWGLFLVPIEPS